MKPILGIDVAKTKLDCALRLPDGKFRSKVVDNTPHGFEIVSAWLAKHNLVDLHVCMEATVLIGRLWPNSSPMQTSRESAWSPGRHPRTTPAMASSSGA